MLILFRIFNRKFACPKCKRNKFVQFLTAPEENVSEPGDSPATSIPASPILVDDEIPLNEGLPESLQRTGPDSIEMHSADEVEHSEIMTDPERNLCK